MQETSEPTLLALASCIFSFECLLSYVELSLARMHTLTKRLEVVVDEGKLTKKSSFGTANSPSLLAVQHYVHDDDNMSVSCRIEATAKCMKTLQLLGHEDTHGTTETSEQNQAVSDITTKASGREQVASDHDQNVWWV